MLDLVCTLTVVYQTLLIQQAAIINNIFHKCVGPNRTSWLISTTLVKSLLSQQSWASNFRQWTLHILLWSWNLPKTWHRVRFWHWHSGCNPHLSSYVTTLMFVRLSELSWVSEAWAGMSGTVPSTICLSPILSLVSAECPLNITPLFPLWISKLYNLISECNILNWGRIAQLVECQKQKQKQPYSGKVAQILYKIAMDFFLFPTFMYLKISKNLKLTHTHTIMYLQFKSIVFNTK